METTVVTTDGVPLSVRLGGGGGRSVADRDDVAAALAAPLVDLVVTPTAHDVHLERPDLLVSLVDRYLGGPASAPGLSPGRPGRPAGGR